MPQRPLEAREAVAATPRSASETFRASLRFRAGTAADVREIVPLINHAYLREAWLVGPPRITDEMLSSELGDATARLIIAEIEGALAGCVRVRFADGGAWFGLLAAFAGYQGQGLASTLVAEAEAFALAEGATTMRLDCAQELGLPPFYASMGYEVESVTPGYRWRAGKNPITRVVMTKGLR